MRAASHLSVVREGDFLPPLVPADVDLRDLPKNLISLEALLDSAWATACDDAEFRLGLRLFVRSCKQVPAGSLPSDERSLAELAGFRENMRRFRALRERALAGWTERSDGRLYHPEAAVMVLEAWLDRVYSRMNGVDGHRKRYGDREEFDLEIYVRSLRAAMTALHQIDKQNKKLREMKAKLAALEAKARNAKDQASEDPDEGQDDLAPPAVPPLAIEAEAKRSEADSSSERSSDDSRRSSDPGQEDGPGGRSEKRTEPAGRATEPIPPWPRDYLAQIRARYPRKRAWGDAEKALQPLRKGGKVAFATILAGIDRLVAEGRDPKYVPYPGSWIRDRGWEDEPEPSGGARSSPPLGGRSPRRNPTFQAAEKIISEIHHDRSPSRDPFSP